MREVAKTGHLRPSICLCSPLRFQLKSEVTTAQHENKLHLRVMKLGYKSRECCLHKRICTKATCVCAVHCDDPKFVWHTENVPNTCACGIESGGLQSMCLLYRSLLLLKQSHRHLLYTEEGGCLSACLPPNAIDTTGLRKTSSNILLGQLVGLWPESRHPLAAHRAQGQACQSSITPPHLVQANPCFDLTACNQHGILGMNQSLIL